MFRSRQSVSTDHDIGHLNRSPDTQSGNDETKQTTRLIRMNNVFS